MTVGRGWSILFAVVMLGCLGIYVAAPFVADGHWWLPPQMSTHAADIDRLYYVILYITGFFFILTEALLVIFMWRFAARPSTHPHAFGHHAMEKKVFWTTWFKHIFRPVSRILHNQHRVEMAWTLVPAAILLYIAFAQVGTWAEVKYRSRMPAIGEQNAQPVQAEVSARQFEWRIRYPSYEAWAKWKTNPEAAKVWGRQRNARIADQQRQYDDVHVVNELHAIKGRPVLVQVRTLDVIHSFNLPHMRVKQDALPGKVIPVWFTPTHSNTKRVDGPDGKPVWVDGGGYDDSGKAKDRGQIWEIACAELCGWGHYRMIGRLYVHDTTEDFEAWLQHAEREQNYHGDAKK
jgi:cytochrome c oxidase subunit 2